MYLVDTSLFVDAAMKREHALDWFERYEKNASHVIVSFVTLGELAAITKKRNWDANRREVLQHILDRFPVYPMTRELVPAYAEVYPLFPKKETQQNDMWISAAAVVTGATIVTVDGHFGVLEGTVGVERVRWRD